MWRSPAPRLPPPIRACVVAGRSAAAGQLHRRGGGSGQRQCRRPRDRPHSLCRRLIRGARARTAIAAAATSGAGIVIRSGTVKGVSTEGKQAGLQRERWRRAALDDQVEPDGVHSPLYLYQPGSGYDHRRQDQSRAWTSTNVALSVHSCRVNRESPQRMRFSLFCPVGKLHP